MISSDVFLRPQLFPFYCASAANSVSIYHEVQIAVVTTGLDLASCVRISITRNTEGGSSPASYRQLPSTFEARSLLVFFSGKKRTRWVSLAAPISFKYDKITWNGEMAERLKALAC